MQQDVNAMWRLPVVPSVALTLHIHKHAISGEKQESNESCSALIDQLNN